MGNLFNKKEKKEAGGGGGGKGEAAAAEQEKKEEAAGGDGDDADAPGLAYYFKGNKTFKKNKAIDENTKRGKLHKTMRQSMLKATLGGIDIKKAVELPPGENKLEWLAVNTIHFFNAASYVYGTCAEFCTEELCPEMSAGPNYKYLWADGVKIKKPVKVSAPQYIDYLFTWIDEQISDPELFPVDEGAKFPGNFEKKVKNIFKRLFRLYGHIYYSHFEKIRDIGAEAHVNTCFRHLIYFILEFKLVEPKELQPLQKLINKLIPGSVPAE